MANPRQRRKARSSSHKPVSHSRNAKKNLKKHPPIRGPKILQDAWDKHKTVRQNYKALGLVHTLDPLASGGVEPVENVNDSQETTAQSSSIPRPRGFGKIIRDESGNVVRVELPDDQEPGGSEDSIREIDMEELEPELDVSVERQWVKELGGGTGEGAGVVAALVQIASSATSTTTLSIPVSDSGPRHSSRGERAYLDRLVKKYGVEDLEAMSKDRKLNFEQRTAGQLKRALRRARLLH